MEINPELVLGLMPVPMRSVPDPILLSTPVPLMKELSVMEPVPVGERQLSCRSPRAFLKVTGVEVAARGAGKHPRVGRPGAEPL